VDGGYMCGGRFIRHVRGTSRVPWIWPEVWQKMLKTSQNKMFNDWELIQRRLASARAKRPPVPAMPTQPYTPRAALQCRCCSTCVSGHRGLVRAAEV
jgi:hypothetical protein